MRLFLDIGHCDRSVKRGVLPGRTIAIVSDTVTGSDHGALLACAEGVADRPDIEQAAKTATTVLGDAYCLAVETDTPRRALEEAFDAANLEVRTGGERGRAAALSALVLQGRRFVIGHVGNVRVWRYRDQQVKQLTRDHLAPRALGRIEVTRACGFTDSIEPECVEEQMKEGDVFLLTSAGVHEVMPGAAILGILQSDHTAQQMADLLTQRAIAARAVGYVGACVARVEKLPSPTASNPDAATLPVVALPTPGTKLDGFAIEKVILKSHRFQLYRAEDRESGETVALRFPDPASTNSAQAFLHEERIARRIESPFILRPLALRPGRRTALYSAIEYRNTENLARRIRRKRGIPLPEALQLGEQLLAALETLHTHGVIHCDVRANNLLYDKFTHRLWMLALGINRGETVTEEDQKPRSSTLSCRAPEMFEGAMASEHSDIYAAGATIYRMLAAKYPYGKIRSADDWREPRRYTPLRHHNETLPGELDDILEHACAVDPSRRYSSVAQFAAALSGVRVRSAVNDMSEGAHASGRGSAAYWPWWVAALLAAGLFAYLYFNLR